MTPFKSLSIKNKLTAIILVITVSVLLVAFAFSVVTQIRTFKRDMVANTVLIARVIADYSVSDLAFSDRSEAARTLERLAAIPNVEYASLFDAQGTLFATYGRPESRDQGSPATWRPSEFRNGVLHVTQQVTYKGELYGTIRLGASTRELDDKIATSLLTMLLAVVLLTALAVLLAIRLQRVISAPVLELADAARKISEGHDYSIRVHKRGQDEIGALCDGFNEMLRQIQERELERDRADRRTREKSRFLANMSHELRTPLNSIIGFSDVLLTRVAERLSPKETKFLEHINTSGQHLLGIINDILDLSRVEAGQMEVNPTPFSIRSVIEGVCHVMRGVSAKRNITLHVEAPEDLPHLEADPVKFKQILYNLLSNAVKFSPYNSTVTTRVSHLRPDGSAVGEESFEIVVSDQGPGIDPKDHELIFQEFRQAEAPGGVVEGTGLGLALVKKFVELHRGTVSLRSARGQGAEFTVLVPRRWTETGTGPVPRILVVEEEQEAFEAVKRQLEGARYELVWARNREEALRLARDTHPAAITLDLTLSAADGWEVLKALKADPETRALPVIIVPVAERGELGPALGAADYFLMPIDQDRLVSRLRSLVTPAAPTRSLLVIDDEPHIHEMLEAWLLPQGYTIDHARFGREGLERAFAQPPDLIVLDLLMEEMDGFEVALRLKSDPRTASIPIIVLTAKDLTEIDRRRLRGRVAALVQKGPATGAHLLATIEALVHPDLREARA